jgi:hypothetical protein
MSEKIKFKQAAITSFLILMMFQVFGLLTSCHKPEWSKKKHGGNKVMYGCISTEYRQPADGRK